MRPTRDEAVDTVRRELGRVEGILARRRAANERSVAEAADAVADRREELAANHAEITAALSGAGDSSPLVRRWYDIARLAAPGVASASWDTWPEGGSGAPEARPWLYRIGTAHSILDRSGLPGPSPTEATEHTTDAEHAGADDAGRARAGGADGAASARTDGTDDARRAGTGGATGAGRTGTGDAGRAGGADGAAPARTDGTDDTGRAGAGQADGAARARTSAAVHGGGIAARGAVDAAAGGRTRTGEAVGGHTRTGEAAGGRARAGEAGGGHVRAGAAGGRTRAAANASIPRQARPGDDEPAWPLAPAPVLVPLIGYGHLGIVGARTRERGAQAEAVISGLLLRLVAASPPGSLRVDVFDPRRLGAGLGGLLALDRPGLLTSYAPHEFDNLLKSLTREIRRIQGSVLAGRFNDLEELAERTGRRPEPWRVVVVYAPAHGFDDDVLSRLHGVMHAGPACGIHLICCDVPMDGIDNAEVLTMRPDDLATLSSVPSVLIRPDDAAPPELVRAVCEQVVTRLGEGQAARRFGDLVPAQVWQASSATGVRAPVGDAIEGGDEPVEVLLGDDPPHALIGGPSGSGKTNFLYVLIGSLAARYGPDELEFYLLDFKEGVSFARFARGRKDPSWLPNARLVGVNINSDREFGLALLRYLTEQLRLRAEAAKRHEVTKLEELRAEDPSGRWPRIVAVIDEFQVLLAARDKITDEAVTLLEDLARRGRSQGIHLVLASQDVNSVEALWGRSSILAQFTLRIALPKARRVLADDNREADRIPRFCAVVNPDSGAETANRVVRLPDAGVPGTLDLLQRDLWQRRPDHIDEPRLFDGAFVPELETSAGYAALAPGHGPPSALVGQVIDLTGSAARVRFGRSPGRNLAVIGSRAGEACDVLGSAALSLARQHEPGTAAFTLVSLDDDANAPARSLRDRLAADGHDVALRGLPDLRPLLDETCTRIDATLAGAPATAAPEASRTPYGEGSPYGGGDAPGAPDDTAPGGAAAGGLGTPGAVGGAVPGAAAPGASGDVASEVPYGEGSAPGATPYGGVPGTPGGAAPGVVGRPVHYLVLYAVDAASSALGGGAAFASSPGLDALRKVVQRGPETRTHVLGWWRTAGRLKDDLAGLAARLDDVGAWVALDVPGAELAPLPGGNLVTWSPRERRALFFDRTVHERPQPVIPYRLDARGEVP